jgi:carbamoyl-phosphate synthase small subunit
MNALLALEDGTWYRGVSAGAFGEAQGEVVFNTSMTGYQEVLTDPSYAGQIVTMTCPQIGNYGIAPEDAESSRPKVAGFVMREASPIASNWRATGTLHDYLVANNIVAIADIDTRALTRNLRSAGVMRGIISTGELDVDALVARARSIPKMEGLDLVRGVTCSEPFEWPHVPGASAQGTPLGHPSAGAALGTPLGALADAPRNATLMLEPQRRAKRRLRVGAYDFGIKWNILRRLSIYGCDVRVFPATAPASELLAADLDGIFLSNGPGDPAALDYAIANTRELLTTDVPMFGICLGHQIMGLALGGKTFKLKFGHRGANHPVKHLDTNHVEITSQNHGFAVDPQSLPSDVKVTHLNLYDGTVEGLRHVAHSAFSVQYHPEASPGPHDADYLFRQFLDEMERRT